MKRTLKAAALFLAVLLILSLASVSFAGKGNGGGNTSGGGNASSGGSAASGEGSSNSNASNSNASNGNHYGTDAAAKEQAQEERQEEKQEREEVREQTQEQREAQETERNRVQADKGTLQALITQLEEEKADLEAQYALAAADGDRELMASLLLKIAAIDASILEYEEAMDETQEQMREQNLLNDPEAVDGEEDGGTAGDEEGEPAVLTLL